MPALLNLLRIKNLALVEELEWQIESGFIAVTGETGAGKSIIIGALQLLLGERADKSLIRTGADLCTVEAIFSGADLRKLNQQLVEAGIEPCENDLIIKRSFSATAGTRQRVLSYGLLEFVSDGARRRLRGVRGDEPLLSALPARDAGAQEAASRPPERQQVRLRLHRVRRNGRWQDGQRRARVSHDDPSCVAARFPVTANS